MGGGGGGVVAGRPAAIRVPLVAAVRPRRLVLDGREEIVHGVCDDHVVIGGHEKRRHHAGQPGTCVANKNQIRVKAPLYTPPVWLTGERGVVKSCKFNAPISDFTGGRREVWVSAILRTVESQEWPRQ